jgi:hypothetical protein
VGGGNATTNHQCEHCRRVSGSLQLAKRAVDDEKEKDDVCECTCPPVSRGSVLITRFQSLNLSPDDIPSIPWGS